MIFSFPCYSPEHLLDAEVLLGKLWIASSAGGKKTLGYHDLASLLQSAKLLNCKRGVVKT